MTTPNIPFPWFFPDSSLAHHLLDGRKGIELGAAAHNAFNLKGECIFVDRCNPPPEQYASEQRKLCGRVAPVDVVADAGALPFPDGSQGYVVSSHVLEHCRDLVATLLEWDRVLAVGGIVFFIVPGRDYNEIDKGRPVTTIQDAITRHTTPATPEEGESDHHWSVFTPSSLWVLMTWFMQTSGVQWEPLVFLFRDDPEMGGKVGNGVLFAAHKTGPAQTRAKVEA